jgi:hypothetical protein
MFEHLITKQCLQKATLFTNAFLIDKTASFDLRKQSEKA